MEAGTARINDHLPYTALWGAVWQKDGRINFLNNKKIGSIFGEGSVLMLIVLTAIVVLAVLVAVAVRRKKNSQKPEEPKEEKEE